MAGPLLVTGTAHVAHLAILAAAYGAADAFFAPAFSGLLPTTVSPTNLQPANALRGLSYSIGSIVGPGPCGAPGRVRGRTRGALLFDAATFAVSIALLLPLRPRLIDASSQRKTRPPRPTTSGPSIQRGLGRGSRRRSWVLAFLGGFAAYHVVVLPAIFVIGPVLLPAMR